MGLTAIDLPDATHYRLYLLAQIRRVSLSRVVEDLIDEASKALTIAQWEHAADAET